VQVATVVGQAVATVKHPSLTGWRLLLVQPLTMDGKADGEPVLALDSLGARRGDRVIACNDGIAAREMVGTKKTPGRWFVLGLCDT
jgi:ethanolamine utilization protein EutN